MEIYNHCNNALYYMYMNHNHCLLLIIIGFLIQVFGCDNEKDNSQTVCTELSRGHVCHSQAHKPRRKRGEKEERWYSDVCVVMCVVMCVCVCGVV